MKYLYAKDNEILEELNRIEVTYKDGVVKAFDPHEWLILRWGIIENLYLEGLCKIRFRKKKNGLS